MYHKSHNFIFFKNISFNHFPVVKNLLAMQGILVQPLAQEDPHAMEQLILWATTA